MEVAQGDKGLRSVRADGGRAALAWVARGLWAATLVVAVWIAAARGGARYQIIQTGWFENYPVMLDSSTGRLAPLAGCYRGGRPGYAGALLISGCTPFRPGTGKLPPVPVPAGVVLEHGANQ
ncbi:MAG: hypothetical protein ACRD1Y_01665 [Terriglobales bacterium]